MRNKKYVLALLIILPLFVTACSLKDLPLIGKFFGGGDDNGGGIISGPVTLTFWGLWERPEVMEALIQKYQESHSNVTINYDDRSIVAVDEYRQRIFNTAGADGAPDLVMVHNSWVPRMYNVLSPAANVDENFVRDNFYATAFQSGTANGNVYALPLFYDGLAIIYNKAHFREVAQMYPPTHWEEFRNLADELTVIDEKSGAILRSGAAIGSANNIDFFSDILGLMFSQADVAIPQNFDTDDAADALRFYTNFVKEDKIWNDQFPEAAMAFAQEKVSMILAPSWVLLDILAVRPDLEIGVAPAPQVNSEDVEEATWASYWMVAVPSGGANTDQAWEFVRFLAEEETQLMYYSEASQYRVFGPPYSLSSLADQIEPNSYLDGYIMTAQSSESGVIAARAGNNEQVTALKEAVNKVLGNVSTPEAALVEAANRIRSAQ